MLLIELFCVILLRSYNCNRVIQVYLYHPARPEALNPARTFILVVFQLVCHDV